MARKSTTPAVPAATTDTRTPAQKAADTRAANKAAKAAESAAQAEQAATPVATPAEPAANVAELETAARSALDTLVIDQDKLADALTALYVTGPWGDTPVADYAATLGIVPLSSPLMTDRRQRVVAAVYAAFPKLPVADVAALTGVSVPTLARDRKDMGLVNSNRSTAQAPKATDDSDTASDTAPAAGTQQTVISIPAFLETLDTASLRMVITLASEIITAREAEQAAA